MQKRITKRVLAGMLALVMSLGLMACQGNSKETQSSSEQTQSSSGQTTKPVDESTVSEETTQEENLYYNKEGWYPICEEEITITVNGRTGTTKDWSKTLMAQVIKEEMGINMEFTTFDDSAWNTQLALMMAEDNMPDLVLRGTWDKAQSNEAGKDGYLLNLADYLDIMPNFAKFLEDNPIYKAYTMTEDGEIFGIAGYKESRSANNRNMIWYSQDDMEKYGFTPEEISTTEGFYNV